MKPLLRPLGLGSTQAVTPPNVDGCLPHSMSGLASMADRARFPRNATTRGSYRPDLRLERRLCPAEFVEPYLTGTLSRPSHDRGDAAAISQQFAFVLRSQARVRESGLMQDRPEAVASVREVVTVGGRAGRRIDTTEDDVQPFAEKVRAYPFIEWSRRPGNPSG